LSAYGNRGIHGDHMGMTKFRDEHDPGFVAVSSQLWLWTNEIEETNQSVRWETLTQDLDAIEARTVYGKTFRTIQGIKGGEAQVFASNIETGGGSVFQGNASAQGDFSLNM